MNREPRLKIPRKRKPMGFGARVVRSYVLHPERRPHNVMEILDGDLDDELRKARRPHDPA